MVRWVGYVVRMEEVRNTYVVFVGKLTGKRLLGRPRHTCKENIKINL